ncbi:hypothetical protein [Streptomyces sp. NBC_01727]|uniref:hypothetical protein n=1 Tax=Streptomyces sp. NBC_01727 TaxID=2975924 RepID=UPI002E1111E3|nr:hypothetical protein OIE76_41105 [Streptomyces sp. NBC_01727]
MHLQRPLREDLADQLGTGGWGGGGEDQVEAVGDALHEVVVKLADQVVGMPRVSSLAGGKGRFCSSAAARGTVSHFIDQFDQRLGRHRFDCH